MTKSMPENSDPVTKKHRPKKSLFKSLNKVKKRESGGLFHSKRLRFLPLAVFAISTAVIGYVIFTQSHAAGASGKLAGYLIDSQGTPLGAQALAVTDSSGGNGQFITSNPFTTNLPTPSLVNIYKMYVPSSFRAGSGTYNLTSLLYCAPYPCSNYQSMSNIQDSGPNKVGYFPMNSNQTTDTRVVYSFTPDPPPPPPPPPPLTYPTISSFGANPNPVTAGSNTNINWSSDANNGCALRSGKTTLMASAPASGTYKTSILNANTSYQLYCNNTNGSGTAGVTKSITVTVNQSPGNPPAPPGPSPVTPGNGGSKGGSSAKSSTSKSRSTSAAASKDTVPPTTPNTFTAKPGSGTVDLSWDASTDNSGAVSYIVERSEDQNTWSVISDTISDTSYSDATASFNMHYYYRLTAVDAAGNRSDAVSTDVTTSGFSPNVKVGEEATINSDDGTVSARIQSGTFDVDVECALTKDGASQKEQKGMVMLGGYYRLNCKDETGTQRTIFTKPVQFTVDLKSFSSYAKYKVFALSDDKLTDAKAVLNKDNKTLSFVQSESVAFGIYGSKGSVSIVKIIIVVLILLALLVVAIRFFKSRLTGGGNDDQEGYDVKSYVAKETQHGAVEQPQYHPHKSLPEMVEEAEHSRKHS
jgi:hypothetical protein